jgi:hypothetical protein
MKTIQIKVYSPDGSFIGLWKEASFDRLTKELGNGVEECIIELGKGFNYGGNDLKLGNFIEIEISSPSIVSAETFTIKTIYKGFISMIEPYIDGKGEGMTVHCLSHASRLASDILKDGATTTLFTDNSVGLTTSAPGDAADVGLIMRAIIDRYRAENSNPQINYTLESLPDISIDGWYVFENKTYQEALDKALELATSDYSYRIDENGIVWLEQKPATPDHKFTIGLNTELVKVQRSIEKIKNFLTIWNGETGGSAVYKHYEDVNSIAQYGRRAAYLKDVSVQDEDAADLVGARFIAENKDPNIKVDAIIIDNYSYIENVKPGDVCIFLNFDDIYADVFGYNLIITRVIYSLDRIEIQADIKRSGILEWQEKTSKQVEDLSRENIPASYT